MRTGLLAFIFPWVLLMAGCGEKQTEQPDPLAGFDTLQVAPGSVLTIQRYRIYLNKNALFRIGKTDMQMTIKDLETGVKAHYTIDSGQLVYNSRFFTARCFISTGQIKTLVTDSTSALQFDTPAYLRHGEKKYLILEYKGNFYPSERPSASCSFTINDTTGLLNNADTRIALKNKTVSSIHTEAYVNGLQWKLYEPVKGQQITKDSILLNFSVRFENAKTPQKPDM